MEVPANSISAHTIENQVVFLSQPIPFMTFAPLVVGALYPSICRGLSADVLATQALSGNAYPVCTSHVVAGRGVVTDVLNVPTDTVSAQLEHVSETESPTGAKVGILGAAPTVKRVFEHLRGLDGPLVYDLTISGPSGEDVIGQQGLEEITTHLEIPDLVTIRRTDAELMAGMEIPSLDDAQVAAQRLAQQGARRVLLRCGKLPTHFYEESDNPPEYALDLLFDGNDFAVFEAPYLSNLDTFHGASSGLLLPLLKNLQDGQDLNPALQKAKARVSEALRAAHQDPPRRQRASFFEQLKAAPTVSDA